MFKKIYIKNEKRYREILFALITVCFALTAANIVLALHLAGHDKNEHHDYENCPICQQAVINKNLVILCSPIQVYQGEKKEYTISYRIFLPPQIIKYQLPQLRAPPSVC